MKNSILLLFIYLVFSLGGLVGCKTDPEPIPQESIKVNVNHLYSGENLVLNKDYLSPQGNTIKFTRFDYYLSNVVAHKTDGTKQLIADIIFLSVGDDTKQEIKGNIKAGTYKGLSFDLGVRQDLNASDPSTFDIDHPLSIYRDMYWGWATMYVFTKMEGFESTQDSTFNFLIHTGLDDLYRPGIQIKQNFNVSEGGAIISISMDLIKSLKNPDYTFNLIQDGQSHTMDNLPLAVQFMDNFKAAFY